MAIAQPTWQVADYDCIIEYTLPDTHTIMSVMTDPEWAEAVKDQVDWVDTSKALLSLGEHTQYLHEGEIVDVAK